MRYAVFSDIHSNLEAFEAVLEKIRQLNVSRYVFAGDIVGYGADPSACIHLLRKLIRDHGCVCVAGNHDHAACGLSAYGNYNGHALRAIEWTKRILTDDELLFLTGLDFVKRTEHFTVVHANLENPGGWGYILDVDDALPSFQALRDPVCFLGHSHRPSVFKAGKTVDWMIVDEVLIEDGRKYLINEGSVGQPRDGDPRASFAVYDTGRQAVNFFRVAYDVLTAQDKIRRAGLPAYLAERLIKGK